MILAQPRPKTIGEDFRKTEIAKPAELYKGLDAMLNGILGRRKRNPAITQELLASAHAIEARAGEWHGLSDGALAARVGELRPLFFRKSDVPDDLLQTALGVVRELAERTLGLRPYEVQLAGAIALFRGNVAEMATGEGKTLTIALTAALWAWSGHPCHVITVNDYLALRDAQKLGNFYGNCGLTVGAVTGEMDARLRAQAYASDIVYATAKELVADFLRDRLAMRSEVSHRARLLKALRLGAQPAFPGAVMSGIHSIIVDEADSILVDEAVTPLIISRAQDNDEMTETFLGASRFADTLVSGRHYRAEIKYRDVELLPEGEAELERARRDRGVPGLWLRKDLIKQALTAREFFHRDRQYVVQDGKIVIVDEFTGRLMPQRTWRSGLHQMIEAKEGIPLTAPSETLSRLGFQKFFRFFKRLAGITGTAQESADELWQIYGLPVLAIPTHKPCIRVVKPRRLFTSQAEKWDAIVEEIAEVHATGRPILIGTRSVDKSEDLSGRLHALGIRHTVLNAVRHREEAAIVDKAGVKGAVTVSTNMAGRGTDIKLGPGVTELGGLHVIATECHESARIDRQLFGRCSRQGDPGTAVSIVSLDDELISRYTYSWFQSFVKSAILSRRSFALYAGHQAVSWAQKGAQRLSRQQRRSVLLMDDWLQKSLSFAQNEIS
jgi:preprotein translocase subunit SecA